MNTIEINRSLSKLKLTSSDIEQILDEKLIIDSILLMVINKDETFENQWEVEFGRDDAKIFLSEYLKKWGYSSELIEKVINNI